MENSHIQWTTHTFNPWIGCTKVSPGCAHCYAEARDIRFADGIHWGKGAPRNRTSAANWRQPLKWDRAAAEALNDYYGHQMLHGGHAHYEMPHRPRVFCASLADWLDDEVPIEWLADLLKLIRRTPNLDWLLLTKRPDNWKARLDEVVRREPYPKDPQEDPSHTFSDWIIDWYNNTVPFNVWMGTSVENQACANERIPALLTIPARVRFLSCEPLLGPVEFSDVTKRADAVAQLGKPALDGIHWVICGGESGANARPFNVDWARSILKQCRAVGCAPFVKQLGSLCTRGEWAPTGKTRTIVGNRQMEMKADVLILKDRKGGDIKEWPEDLRVREFPK